VKQDYLKPSTIKLACIRTIALLLFFLCVVSVVARAETHDIPKAKSSDEPITAGDWNQAFFNAAHTGNNRFETQLNRHNVANLTQLWASPVGVGTLYTSPVVSNGKVYIGSGDGQMYAFDALTGATLWVGAQQPVFFDNSAAVGQGLVFAHSLIGPLIAYDADTGEIVWTSDIADVARAAPVLAGRVLYVAGSEGELYALDASTGTVRWSTPPESSIFNQAPTVAGGRVFEIRTRSHLSAYDARTGEILWELQDATSASLTAALGKLFVSGGPGDPMVALDQATGNVVWSAQQATIMAGAPAFANGLLFVPQGSGLKALNAETGALVWTAPAYSIWSPAVANGVVYASNLSGEWDAFDARDGTELWSVTTASGCGGACANGTPAVANGILYLPGPDNFLRAYTVQTR
jgi:outer membrane protein assembly factor BamB